MQREDLFGHLLHAYREKAGDGTVRIGRALLSVWLFGWGSREALWALAITAALLGVGWSAPHLPDPEWGVVAACVVVLVYWLHFLTMLPMVVLWGGLALRVRLPPRQLLRVVLYRIVMRVLAEADAFVRRNEATPWYVRSGYKLASVVRSMPHEDAAWAVACAAERQAWLMLLKAFVLGVMPILGVAFVFRSVFTFGRLLDETAHLTVWDAPLYPIAAIADALFGTEFRALLLHR